MNTLTIDAKKLDNLFLTNSFVIPEGSTLVFIGIRGALPANTADTGFKLTQVLNSGTVDYKNLNCTFLQWNKTTGEIAAFAGSTVPSISNILGYRARPPRNSNCLCPGFYRNYRKGKHRPANTGNWHDAFRQDGQPLTIRRTYDNNYYDNFDTIEVSLRCDDNIHAAWTLETDNNYFSSAGCQVIMGIPYCEKTRSMQNDNRGPWKDFKNNAYGIEETSFPYALFTAAEVSSLLANVGTQVSGKLKFGSSGTFVQQVQQALISQGYLKGPADGDFGKDTFNAVKKLQTEKFGLAAVDGVVGPVTALALGLPLPVVSV